MSNRAKKEKRLEKAGYKTKKGVFKKFKAKKRGGENSNGNNINNLHNNFPSNNINNNHNNSPSNNENNSIEELIELNSDTDVPEVPAAPVGFFKGKPLGLRNSALKGRAGIKILQMLEPRNAAALAVSGKGPEKENMSIQKLAKRKLNFEKKKILKRLTKNGNITVDEALIKAVRDGKKREVIILLDARADTDVKDEGGWTPLHFAARKGHTDIVKLLLDAGANKEVRERMYGYTPLHYAVQYGHTDIVKLLLDAGANKEVRERMYSMTPLHWAASFGRTDIVKLLLDAGAEKDVEDKWGKTPYNLAEDEGEMEIVNLLKSNKSHKSKGGSKKRRKRKTTKRKTTKRKSKK